MFARVMTRAKLHYRAWRYRVKLDPSEIKWMRRVLTGGEVTLDIGAHKGAYTYWMRRRVGLSGKVFAFEPQPALADYLVESVKAFGWRNVFVESMGLSSTPGELTLYVPGNGPSPSATFVKTSVVNPFQNIRVPVDTLDNWLERQRLDRRIRLIKCDVEGYELEVFIGGLHTLVNHKPLILLECENRHNSNRAVSDVFVFLEEHGYQGHFYWRGQETAVENFEPDVHQVLGAVEYVNNFVFVSEGRSHEGSPNVLPNK